MIWKFSEYSIVNKTIIEIEFIEITTIFGQCFGFFFCYVNLISVLEKIYTSIIVKKISVSDCCLTQKRYHGENKLIFNEMMMRSALS